MGATFFLQVIYRPKRILITRQKQIWEIEIKERNENQWTWTWVMDLFLDATVRNCISDNESVAFFFTSLDPLPNYKYVSIKTLFWQKIETDMRKLKKMKIGQLKHLLWKYFYAIPCAIALAIMSAGLFL